MSVRNAECGIRNAELKNRIRSGLFRIPKSEFRISLEIV